MENTKEKINWRGEFGFNEELHSTAESISAVYGRLFYENKENPNHDFWKSKMIEWGTYEYNIFQLKLDTKEECDAELRKVRDAWQEADRLEKEIGSKKIGTEKTAQAQNTEEKIYWIGEFGINEALHSTSESIAATYSRLRYNNEKHPDYDFWKSKMIEWRTYKQNLFRLDFDTEKEANAEVERLTGVLREVTELEKEIAKKNG